MVRPKPDHRCCIEPVRIDKILFERQWWHDTYANAGNSKIALPCRAWRTKTSVTDKRM